ncbi:MAG: DNA recombination protein RmuC [Bacteroidia bacterium]|nr:DNA recombination protein RmuC [Bacteroidia bacterium]
MNFIFLLSGLILGFVTGWLFLTSKHRKDIEELDKSIALAGQEHAVLQERESGYRTQLDSLRAQAEKDRETTLQLNRDLAISRTLFQALEEKLNNQIRETEALQSKFTKEFENLANRILDEKTQKFTDQNRSSLEIILNPFKEKIQEFEKKVDEVYKTESAERNSLKGEIRNMVEMNKQISEEAGNLAKALKGDTKKQGNWGEMILEKILERSGLTRGIEYELQVSTTSEDGKRIQPDVVIQLPDNKHIIVDSKVSLVAYEALVNAENEDERQNFLKEHIQSVRSHIRQLSEKSYHSSPDFSSPEFVLMFMPIESSFGIALQADHELFSFAWERKIVIVSPTTLLASLQTIASIWKQEKQTRNALEIARQGGALYDKFKNFVDDLIDVGKKMDAAKSSYADAMNKLSTGSGNIIRRVEELKRLGAKTTKDIPQALVERADDKRSG